MLWRDCLGGHLGKRGEQFWSGAAETSQARTGMPTSHGWSKPFASSSTQGAKWLSAGEA